MANNLKQYDAFQVLRSVFDVNKNCLRVCITDPVDGGGSGIEIAIDHTEDSIRLGDGTSFITSTSVGGKLGYDFYIINENLDIRDLSATQDNVAISDGTDTLDINSDGSINVVPGVNNNFTGLQKYNEISALASGTETTIISHTAVGGRSTYLQRVAVSGDNIAKYRVKINGITIDTARTYFGSELNHDLVFDGSSNLGIEVNVGDVITVTVVHNRPMSGDFNGKIQYLEVI